MRRIVTVLCCLAALLLFGCNPKEEVIAQPTPAASQEATPTVRPTPAATATPMPTPTPTPTPEPYAAADFLPMEDLFLRYETEQAGIYKDSYVEYIKKEDNALQRRTRLASEDAEAGQDAYEPEVDVYCLQEGALVQIYHRQAGYTHNFISTALRKNETVEVLLKEPVSVGNSWPIEGGESEITAVDAQLSLPIGDVSAVEVTTRYEDGSFRIRYYMRGVGLVSESIFDPQGQQTSASNLSMREIGRAFKQVIYFYFGDQSDDSIRYIRREISIKEGTSMTSRLADELRKIPSGSKLVSIPPSARIRSITPNYEGGVKVDFSEEFVTDMIADRQGELLLLQALADTFGSYYQTSKVYFTIEGENYESRYRMIRTDKGEHYVCDVSTAQRYS